MLEVSRQREAVPREDMETPLADASGCALGPSGFRIFCTCPQSGLERGWRSAIRVPGPQGPRPGCPRGRKGVGSQESGMLQERGQHDEGPWDAGLQVCPDRACHTSASRDVVDLFPH